MLNAALSGLDRHAAIGYVLRDQDEVVLEEKRRDDDGEGDEAEACLEGDGARLGRC